MKAALCVLVMLGLAGLSMSASTASPESCSAEISAQCPDVDDYFPVYLPDPADCGKYCECSNGVAVELECPPGTLFNPLLDTCDNTDDVDCGDRPIDE